MEVLGVDRDHPLRSRQRLKTDRGSDIGDVGTARGPHRAGPEQDRVIGTEGLLGRGPVAAVAALEGPYEFLLGGPSILLEMAGDDVTAGDIVAGHRPQVVFGHAEHHHRGVAGAETGLTEATHQGRRGRAIEQRQHDIRSCGRDLADGGRHLHTGGGDESLARKRRADRRQLIGDDRAGSPGPGIIAANDEESSGRKCGVAPLHGRRGELVREGAEGHDVLRLVQPLVPIGVNQQVVGCLDHRHHRLAAAG